jgi:hypothetical protein
MFAMPVIASWAPAKILRAIVSSDALSAARYLARVRWMRRRVKEPASGAGRTERCPIKPRSRVARSSNWQIWDRYENITPEPKRQFARP